MAAKIKTQKVTARQIGEIVGCCQQAVSAVLSGRGNSKVSREKQEKIFEVARDLGYQPNLSALRLAGHPTRTIGVIPGTSVFAAEMLVTLATRLRTHDYKIISSPLVTAFDENQIISSLLNYGADGIIIMNKRGPLFHNQLKVPAVLVSYSNFDLDYDWENGARQAVEHMLGHGHRRIAFLLDNWGYSAGLISQGYRGAMGAAGLACSEDWSIKLTWNAAFAEQLQNLIEREKVTAFLCTDSIIAGRLSVWLRQHGYRVPEDLGIICFRGTSFDETLNPSLTSLAYPAHELASRAADLIVAKIQDKQLERSAQPEKIPARLHPGRSCGCAEQPLEHIWWEGVPVSVEGPQHHLLPRPAAPMKK